MEVNFFRIRATHEHINFSQLKLTIPKQNRINFGFLPLNNDNNYLYDIENEGLFEDKLSSSIVVCVIICRCENVWIVVNLPTHLESEFLLLNRNPLSQTHSNDPGELMHLPFPQISGFSTHSSISAFVGNIKRTLKWEKFKFVRLPFVTHRSNVIHSLGSLCGNNRVFPHSIQSSCSIVACTIAHNLMFHRNHIVALFSQYEKFVCTRVVDQAIVDFDILNSSRISSWNFVCGLKWIHLDIYILPRGNSSRSHALHFC